MGPKYTIGPIGGHRWDLLEPSDRFAKRVGLILTCTGAVFRTTQLWYNQYGAGTVENV